MNKINLDKFFTSWNEGETGYFKVAPIKLSIVGDANKLELMAKDTAKEIEAEVSYAWDLGELKSEAWWLEWGGFSLEEEIPYYAAISMAEAIEKIQSFDPNENDYECETLEEFKEMLFNAYDEDLKKEDLLRGFQMWVKSMDAQAVKVLEHDLKSWTSRAK